MPAAGPAKRPSSTATIVENCVVRSARALRILRKPYVNPVWEQSVPETEPFTGSIRPLAGIFRGNLSKFDRSDMGSGYFRCCGGFADTLAKPAFISPTVLIKALMS